jgi:hypothetical protein
MLALILIQVLGLALLTPLAEISPIGDLSIAQTVIGSGGAFAIIGLVEMTKRTVLGLVSEDLWGRLIPGLTLLLGAIWNVIVANVLFSMGLSVTWNGWILAYLTVLAALSAMGLYSGTKASIGR